MKRIILPKHNDQECASKFPLPRAAALPCQRMKKQSIQNVNIYGGIGDLRGGESSRLSRVEKHSNQRRPGCIKHSEKRSPGETG